MILSTRSITHQSANRPRTATPPACVRRHRYRTLLAVRPRLPRPRHHNSSSQSPCASRTRTIGPRRAEPHRQQREPTGRRTATPELAREANEQAGNATGYTSRRGLWPRVRGSRTRRRPSPRYTTPQLGSAPARLSGCRRCHQPRTPRTYSDMTACSRPHTARQLSTRDPAPHTDRLTLSQKEREREPLTPQPPGAAAVAGARHHDGDYPPGHADASQAALTSSGRPNAEKRARRTPLALPAQRPPRQQQWRWEGPDRQADSRAFEPVPAEHRAGFRTSRQRRPALAVV